MPSSGRDASRSEKAHVSPEVGGGGVGVCCGSANAAATSPAIARNPVSPSAAARAMSTHAYRGSERNLPRAVVGISFGLGVAQRVAEKSTPRDAQRHRGQRMDRTGHLLLSPPKQIMGPFAISELKAAQGV